MRWCTKKMKIEPIEDWVGTDDVTSYVAIRADEASRKGYVSTKPNIITVLPFVEDGIDHAGVMRILKDSGLGLPDYYEWRSRSGCYFCFYQRKAEWIGLADRHPELFQKAVEIESKIVSSENSLGKNFSDFAMKERQYTWSSGETLPELLGRRVEILSRHEVAVKRQEAKKAHRPLWEVVSDALDDDDDSSQCDVCAL